jgi:biotin carboxylase
VHTAEELEQAVAAALGASRAQRCMIEELVDGPEVTVVGFSSRGTFRAVVVTDRVVADPPAFGVALAHVFPSTALGLDRVVETARHAAEALGIENGPTYTQLRVGANGPQVVELAARLGGGHDAELAECVTGFPLNRATIAAALGEDPPSAVEARRAAAAVTRFLIAPPGELRSVSGLEEAEAADGVEYVRVYRRPGQRIEPLRHGPDRAGAILAVGDTREEALDRAERAAALVRFETGNG